MRKLLHLVFAVWKTNRPFNEHHFPWEPPQPPEGSSAAAQPPPTNAEVAEAVGHKRAAPAELVVTTADPSVAPTPAAVHPAPTPATPARPRIDFAFLRGQSTLEQVLRHLGWFDPLRGRGPQRRGPCPLHGQATDPERPFSVHRGKNLCQCFQADCARQGTIPDFWAAAPRLPLYDAALHLAATFQLPRNSEEEHVL